MAGRVASSESEIYKIIGILNNQPDVLTAIVKQRMPNAPETKGHLGDLFIQDIDRDGRFVQIALRPPPTREEVIIKLPFEPPLKSAWDARPRLMQWRAAAQNYYKIPTHPPITYFKTPRMFPFTLPLGGALVFLLTLYFGEGKSDLIDRMRAYIGEKAGYSTIEVCVWVSAFLHLLAEPALMIWMTGKHQTPLVPRLKWLAWNVAVGWGAIDEFYECTLYEKVRHVYKQTDVGDIGPCVKETVVEGEKKTQ